MAASVGTITAEVHLDTTQFRREVRRMSRQLSFPRRLAYGAVVLATGDLGLSLYLLLGR